MCILYNEFHCKWKESLHLFIILKVIYNLRFMKSGQHDILSGMVFPEFFGTADKT